MTRSVYFDNAATTPLHPEVVEAMLEHMRNTHGNPSSIHASGRTAKALLEKSRRSIAQLMGCAPSEIFFTSGGTESDNTALSGLIDRGEVSHLISSPIEHHAITHTLEYLGTRRGIPLSWVRLMHNGHIDPGHLSELLSVSPSALVSLMHGNNEIGNMIDLQDVGSLCRKNGALFHTDAVQTVGYFPFNLQVLPVDLLSASAHKFNGPKGVGFLYLKAGLQPEPFIHGGGQERQQRGGTENLHSIVGMTRALELAYAHMKEKEVHIRGLRERLIGQLRERIAGVYFNGDVEGHSLYTVVNVSFPLHPNGEMLLFNLDIHGICASGGSACSSGSQVGSHVLQGIGADTGRHHVRFSLGYQNTEEEVDYVVETLSELLSNP
ncbi:MAG: cysteine desulfurase [Sphingomonadales bacterium]|nr:cysteine desulfurase [Sphingomonadales bacterium]